ncbi:MAG: sulfatase [Vicinamibacteria bacterium]
MMRRAFSAMIVLGILAAAGFAVSLALRPRPNVVVFDLADRLPFASRTSSRDFIAFGWPEAEQHLVRGFGGDPEARGREKFLWVRQGAAIKVDAAEARDRVLVFDIEAYQGIEDQRLSLTVNGMSLGVQEIPSTRSRVRFDWPGTAQGASNEIGLQFSRAIVPANEKGGSGDTRDFAAALFSVSVSEAKDDTVDLLLERETPRAFEITAKDGVPSFVLPGRSQTSFAFRLPANATLEFEAALHPWSLSSGGKGSLQISFDASDGRRRRSVQLPLGRETTTPTKIALTGEAGTPFIVRMEVVSENPGLTFAAIRAPRILGDAEAVPRPASTAALRLADDVKAAKPNVLFVVLDAARAQSFGAYGHRRATTPNIDRFSKDGFTFDNAYTTAAFTNSAMSSVWTSEQPDRHHGNLSWAAKLPADRLMLAEVLTAQSVYSAGFVANAVAGTYNNFDRGFKEFSEPFTKYGSQASAFRNVLPSFLDRMKADGKRFFAYVHYREPHEPYDPPPPFNTVFGPDGPIPKEHRDGGDVAKKWLKDVNDGTVAISADELDHLQHLYDGNLAFADQEIGWLRGELESRSLFENTLVILTGDHGEALFEHGWIGHNAQVFEESAHVPLIVALPKALRAAHPPARVDSLVDHTDIAPTVLEAFGLLGTGGSAKSFQGHSLFSLMAEPTRAAKAGDSREVLTRTIWDRPIYSLRNSSHTFILNTANGESSLFDRSTLPRLEDKDHDLGPRAPIALRETYRQNLLAWIAKLKRGGDIQDDLKGMTKDVCEQMKALGYLTAKYPCPAE